MQEMHPQPPSSLHEYIVMPNVEFPINFIRHRYNGTGPFCLLHWHKEIELVYVREGRVTASCGSKSVTAGPGDIIYINSNELHDYTILDGPVDLLCNTISLSMLQGKFPSSYDSRYLHPLNNLTVFRNLIEDDDRIERMLLEMWEEYEAMESGYEYAIKSQLYGIITRMIRCHVTETISNREYMHRKRSLHNINIVLKYIEEHFTEQLSLDELAALLNINKFYFCRFFKDSVGSTPTEYINHFRVHRAISLMNGDSKLTITEIATSVGFNDSNYFTRVFKSVIHMSPSEYRNQTELPRHPLIVRT